MRKFLKAAARLTCGGLCVAFTSRWAAQPSLPELMVIGLVKDPCRREVRSSGKSSKNECRGAWAQVATASPQHHVLTRRHLKTGDLAVPYCFVPTVSRWAPPGSSAPLAQVAPWKKAWSSAGLLRPGEREMGMV